MGQGFGRNAYSIVDHVNPDFACAGARAQFDLAALRRVFRRVGQKIRKYLLQTDRIGTDKHGHVQDMLGYTVLAPCEERTHAFDSVGDGLPDICLLYTSDAADERSSVDLGGRR